MNSLEARRACRMATHVNWLKQKSGPVAPKVAKPVVEPVPPVVVQEEPAPVVEQPVPAEPVAPAPEPVQQEVPVDVSPTNCRKMETDELLTCWGCNLGNANIEAEIFRRARKFAKKNNLELPEGECTGDNVQNFVNVLKTPVE